MLDKGLPLTRETYLDIAHAGGMPEEWTAEDEMELPRPFQRHE